MCVAALIIAIAALLLALGAAYQARRELPRSSRRVVGHTPNGNIERET